MLRAARWARTGLHQVDENSGELPGQRTGRRWGCRRVGCCGAGTPKRPSAASTTSATLTSPGISVARLGLDLQDESCPTEVHSLGWTLRLWLPRIIARHRAKVSNGPTRGHQQSDRADQTHRVRVPAPPLLLDPGTALRRATRLGATRHRHTPLKSEEPDQGTLGQPADHHLRTVDEAHPISARFIDRLPCERNGTSDLFRPRRRRRRHRSRGRVRPDEGSLRVRGSGPVMLPRQLPCSGWFGTPGNSCSVGPAVTHPASLVARWGAKTAP
jgi:hypothetical protein